MNSTDTIAAIATGSGIGGVGVIRISGMQALEIAQKILGKMPIPRHAHYCSFNQADGESIDEGLLIYFKAPHSFTGEDVVELQGHGGLIPMQRLLKRCLELGAKMARAGEFTERAFFNNKLDLVQAEAIHDLIMSQSEAQAKAAIASLQGVFSKHIQELLAKLIHLRVYVEASIDFSDEEIDFLEDGAVLVHLSETEYKINHLLAQAQQGKILQEGINIVLAGEPNMGKSSLLNALSGTDSAIVTDIAGTTRDVLREHININGLPLHIFDTAGIRDTDNPIEQEGIRRAKQALTQAHLIIWLTDWQNKDQQNFINDLDMPEIKNTPLLKVVNKVDLTNQESGVYDDFIAISAKNLEGIEALKQRIVEIVGFQTNESLFSARTRHIESLLAVQGHLLNAKKCLINKHQLEIIAEELRLAQDKLNEITGAFTTDDLLGEIFSSFCIGK